MSSSKKTEPLIKITAQLNKDATISTINAQLEKLKVNNIKVGIDTSAITSNTTSTQVTQAVSKIQQQLVGKKFTIPFDYNAAKEMAKKSSTTVTDEIDAMVKRINGNIGKIQKISVSNLVDKGNGTSVTRWTPVEDKEKEIFSSSSKAVLTYKNELQGTSKVLVEYDRANNQVSGTITSMSADYAKLRNIEEKAAQQAQKAVEEENKDYIKLGETLKQTNTQINSVSEKMYNLDTPTTPTGSSNVAYQNLVNTYEQLIELRRKYENYSSGNYNSDTGLYDTHNLSTQKEMLAELQNQVQKVSQAYSTYNKEVKYANTTANSRENESNALKRENQQQELLNSKIKQSQINVKALGNQWSKIHSNADLSKEYDALIQKSHQVSTSADLKQFNSDLQTFKAKCREAGVATLSLADGAKKAFKNFSYFFGASRLIYSAINGIKQVVQNVYTLNTAMTELKKVTNETSDSYDRYLTKAKANSQSVGSGLSDYVTSTADFAKLGYSMNTSAGLAKIASIDYNVFDDVQSIDDVTKSLVTSLKSFNVEGSSVVSKAEKISNSLNEVSNNYAVSSGDLTEGLANSAAAMSTANNTLDQTIALLTAGTEVTQNASEMGNSLKVVSMRLRGATTELESAGEETDGVITSTSKLQKKIEQLTNTGNGGFNILESDGKTFKSTYEMLKGISKVYDKLTDTNKASLLEIIAGKLRGNQVASILQNFDTAEKSLNTSQNSDGSIEKENERKLDSMEGKLKQLQSTWESFSSDLLNDKALISLLGIGNQLLKTVDTFVSHIGTIPTLLGGLGIVLLIKNLGRPCGLDNLKRFYCA